MTGWGVERTPRTAYPAPVGARTPMPPLSQGAARRARWGLRALVIGGLAGAAWLLTGSAAQAADHDPATGGLLGSSLVSIVADGDTAAPAVDRILKVAAQPLDRDRPARERAPIEALAETLDEVLPSGTTDADGSLRAVDRVVRDISGPLRLTGGSEDARPLTPVTAPLTRTLRPVTDLLHHAAPATAHRPAPAVEPATDEAPAIEPATDEAPVTAPAAGEAPAVEPAPNGAAPNGAAPNGAAPNGAAQQSGEVARPKATGIAAGAGAADIAGPGERRSSGTDRHPAVSPATTPGGEGPAPLQVHLGAGISTSASGVPTEGGSAAYLPAVVAGDPVAHRSPAATDVDVRCHDAEAPTVSPD